MRWQISGILSLALFVGGCASVAKPLHYKLQEAAVQASPVSISVSPIENLSDTSRKFFEVGVTDASSMLGGSDVCNGEMPDTGHMTEMLVQSLSRQGLAATKRNNGNSEYLLKSTIVEASCADVYASGSYSLPLFFFVVGETKSSIVVKVVSNLIEKRTGIIVDSLTNYGYSSPETDRQRYLFYISNEVQYRAPFAEHFTAALNSVATSIARRFAE